MRFATIVAAENDVRVSAVTDYEARLIVFHRQGQQALEDYQLLVKSHGMVIAAFDQQHSAAAFDAYRRFGKGNHGARLNFADCAVYALAKTLNAPLLFKGSDFSQTDVLVAS